jgi:MFS transporter, AAHS family, 3-hydroxyphenylpropionic acid transporter
MCEGFDVQAVGVAASGMVREFKPSTPQLGWAFSASNVGLLFGALLGGRLSDRFGLKVVLVSSLGIFGLFSLLIVRAPDMGYLIWMRALTGLGLGGATPNAIALAAGANGDGPRSADIAISYVGMPLGGALVGLVGLVVDQGQWRQVFVVGGIAPLVTTAAMTILMPSPGGPSLLTSTPGQGVVRALFGRTRLARTLVLWSGFFLVVLILHLMLNWLPLLLQWRGLSKTQAMLAQIGLSVGGAAAAVLLGHLLDTRWRRVSIVVTAIAFPVLLAVLAVDAAPSLTVGIVLLVGGGILASQVALFGFAGWLYSPPFRGTAIGAAVGAGRVGSIVGPASAALLIGAGRTPQDVLIGLLPLAMLCGACVTFLGWPDRKAGSPEKD